MTVDELRDLLADLPGHHLVALNVTGAPVPAKKVEQRGSSFPDGPGARFGNVWVELS